MYIVCTKMFIVVRDEDTGIWRTVHEEPRKVINIRQELVGWWIFKRLKTVKDYEPVSDLRRRTVLKARVYEALYKSVLVEEENTDGEWSGCWSIWKNGEWLD